MCSVLISYCVCRRPSWTPKTQPNDSSAVVWLSFWCSTRFTRKKCLSQRGEMCRLHSYIFWYLIFGLALSAPLFWEILPGHETTNKSIGFPFTNNGTIWQNLDLCLWIQLKYWPNSLVLTFRVEEVAKILKNFTKNVSKAKFISWNDLKYAINAS